ncbi:hypothetical protein SLE2022_117220 [Rubroshorea leprosula]
MEMKGSGGEIVQVQGGHIVRSTGRKDRHSKVYTAKGPRDRRVRLSAHTAIQFYDVQDRLGYDRPSKAVDWLIKKAKSAIDKLAELPPWDPNVSTSATVDAEPDGGTGKMTVAEQSDSSGYNYQLQRPQLDHNQSNEFVAGQIDETDMAMADSMKSFFPTSTAGMTINFQNYPPEIISRTANPSEDLGLSLHSFQDPRLIQGESQGDTSHSPSNSQTLFSGSALVGLEANFQRMVGAGFMLNPPPFSQQQAVLGQGSGFSLRGPLQSSFVESFRAWNDLPIASTEHHKTHEIHQASTFGGRFATDAMPGFSVLARIHGDDKHDAASDRPTSSSPNLHN